MITKWSEIVAMYPNMDPNWNSGGHCMVAKLERDNGVYMLFTNEDDGVPTDDDKEIVCGLYNEDGQINVIADTCDLVPIEEVEAWIDSEGKRYSERS